MNRKIILIALIAILSICIGVCVIACDNVHTHELEKIDAVDSTCTTKGNIQHWYCKGCNKYFSDANATLEISKDDTFVELDSNNHNYQTVSLDATCTQEGGERLVCSYDNSHFQVLESVPALGHEMKKDGVCSVCNNVVSKELRFELNEDGNSYTVYSIYSDMTSAADMKEKDIVIPAKYMGKPVTAIGDFAFSLSAVYDYNDFLFIESVTIPNTVTSIGECAFMTCITLKQVNIPDSVTKIGDYAFDACFKLNEIEIPASVTDFGENVFANAHRLVHVVNRSGIDLFVNDLVTGVEICDDSSKFVNEISVDDNGVQTYTIGDKVWILDYLGDDNTLDLSAYNNIYGIYRGAFYYSRLSSIILPPSVNEIGIFAFSESELLEEIILPNGVTSIGSYAVSYCSSLMSIIIPNSVTSISVCAFENCDKLIIFCEAASKPSGWNSNWNYSNRPVIWGFNYKSGGVTEDGIIWGLTHNIEIVVAGYIGNDTQIEIPNAINGYSVTTINSGAFSGCSGITSITIPNSVIFIRNDAFRDCSSLTSIKISDSVTHIGSDAFRDCSGLTSITIPSSVTYIDYSAFRDCSGLTSITIPSSVTYIGGWAFSGCSGLTSITIPSSVTYIGYSAFSGCSSLTSITIPDSITTIDSRVFSDCSSLTGITIPNSVTTIGDSAFMNCSGLTSITIPDSVTTINDDAFWYCSSLTSIMIPSSVTFIGSNAFMNCSNLTIYCVAASKPSGWDSNWNSDRRPVVWGDIREYGATEDGIKWVLTNSNEMILTGYSGSDAQIEIPDIINGHSVTHIINNAFISCSSLTGITIPDSVTFIGSNAFSGCSSLTSIIIPSSVTFIGSNAFMDCRNLTIYCVAASEPSGWDSNWNSDRPVVWDIKESGATEDGIKWVLTNSNEMIMTGYSGSNAQIEIPNSINGHSITRIDKNAFYHCNLQSIYCKAASKPSGWDSWWNYDGKNFKFIPVVWDTKEYGVTEDRIMWGLTNNNEMIVSRYFGSDTQIEIPDTINGHSVTTIGEYAFWSCISLTSITIPDSVTTINDDAFWYCTSLTRITIPSSVTYIGNSAFKDCRRLTRITIPSSVTHIGSNAFRGCSGLTSITISGSVTYIGNEAFMDCSNLTIYCEAASEPGWNIYWNPDNRPVVWGYKG
ncbi:MAG: leucine-rich repeat domain-containing protein [Clostridia bacterium]|nr:leucine-rich repeat domain-containing protein [Clostridia bacterium]